MDNNKMNISTSLGNQSKYYKNGYWFKEDLMGYEGMAEEGVFDILRISTLEPKEFAVYECINGWGCKSLDFLKEGQRIITFSRLFKTYGYNYEKELTAIKEPERQVYELIKRVKEFSGVDTEDYLRKVFTLDSFIFNEDRHLNNLSIILNGDTTFQLCPIFDNGLSLLANKKDYPDWGEHSTISQLKRVKSKPFEIDFIGQMSILGVGFHIFEEAFDVYIKSSKERIGRIYNILEYSKKLHEREGLFW